MKFLARMMMVLGLLGVLAYGSFALGKYVLSAKLFGDDGKSGGPRAVSRSTTEASAVTRQTGWKGAKPRVEVKVLPADQTSSSPELPEFTDEDGFSSKNQNDSSSSRAKTRASEDDSPRSTPSKPTIKRNVDDGAAEYSLGGENRKVSSNRDNNDDNEGRPRRRRRRRHSSRERKSDASRNNRAKTENSTARSDSAPAGDGHETASSNGDDSKISVTSGDSNSRERSGRSTRVRERSRSNGSGSPVPKPESSGSSSGGDSASISPVPQPD